MSEASGRAEMERRLIQRSLQDDDFRRRLLEDPEASIERELGVGCPRRCGWWRWRRLRTPSTWCFPVSRRSSKAGSGLSDQELEAVAGGGGDTSQFMCTYTCPPPQGATCATCDTGECTG